MPLAAALMWLHWGPARGNFRQATQLFKQQQKSYKMATSNWCLVEILTVTWEPSERVTHQALKFRWGTWITPVTGPSHSGSHCGFYRARQKYWIGFDNALHSTQFPDPQNNLDEEFHNSVIASFQTWTKFIITYSTSTHHNTENFPVFFLLDKCIQYNIIMLDITTCVETKLCMQFDKFLGGMELIPTIRSNNGILLLNL